MIPPTKHRRKATHRNSFVSSKFAFRFIFMGLSYQIPPPPEEGISINFGNQDFGSGQEQSEDILEDQIISSEEVNNSRKLKIFRLRILEETTHYKT